MTKMFASIPGTKTGRRMRVCHLVIQPDLAGSQRMMLDLCRRLDPAHYERHVICQGEGPLTEALREAGIRRHLVPSLRRATNPLDDWRAQRQITAICRREQFDIVHTHNSKGGILGRIGARRAGTPGIVHHVHGFAFHEFSSRLSRLVYSNVERVAGRFCDRVVFVNDEERQMSIDEGWLPADKCVTIYNGVDLARFKRQRNMNARADVRHELGLQDNEVAILFCGRLEAQKQPLILAEIAAAVEQRQPAASWRLVVAGTGSLEPALREGFRRHNVLHRYCPIGWHSEPHKVVNACDISLLPSLWEGLPLSLIEAQASGLPIVASDVKGNREVVTPQTGVLCEPKTATDYATALVRLIDDVDLRRQQGRAARQRAEAEFSAELCFRRVTALYDELCGVRTAAAGTSSQAA